MRVASAGSAISIRRRFFVALSVAVLTFAGLASAQTRTFDDSAIPISLVSEPFYSIVDVLNQDLGTTQYATENALNQGYTCSSSGQLSAIQSFAYDGDLFQIGTVAGGTSLAVSAYTSPYYTGCESTRLAAIPGLATRVLATGADARHKRVFVVSGDGGTNPETIIGFNAANFNANPMSTLVPYPQANLDMGAQYTSVVSDADGDFGSTVITELRTATTAGNLWVYLTNGRAYKILAPDGSPLPALGAFIIHNPYNIEGSLLVLINQDGLTPANSTSPPIDPTPFSIIDLGQLQQLIDVNTNITTITLPSITKINATLPYYAMLGAGWNPVDHLLYAVVGGADAGGNIFRKVIAYDPSNPSTPNETVIADVTSIPIIPPNYPQIALNGAAGTMQFLLPTPTPAAAYSVGIKAGATNTVTQITGNTFALDSAFAPTAMVVNPLAGNTWFASSSGKVDVLTLPGGSTLHGFLDLNAPLIQPTTGDDSSVSVLAYFPEETDTGLSSTTITITATPQNGDASYTFATVQTTSARVDGAFVTGTFAKPGLYTLTASFPGDSQFPAVTSSPVIVSVATQPFKTTIALTATSTSTTAGQAIVTLTSPSYAPTGTINVLDATSNAVLGSVSLTKGNGPVTIPITFPAGTTTVVASYSGDTQNQQSTSPNATIVPAIGPKVTPTLSLSVAGTTTAGSTVTGTATMTSSSTTAPTGNITIYSIPIGSTTPTTLTTVPAAQAEASGGESFSFAAPATGSYTIYASYAGDSTYNSAVSSNTTLVVSPAPVIGTNLKLTTIATTTPGTFFNATVALTPAATSTPAPTGNVVLTATPTGGTATTLATITTVQALATGGFAAPVFLANAGSYTLTASYAGDTNYGPSTSSATVTVTGLGTALTVAAVANPKINTPFNATVSLTSSGTSIPAGNVVVTATLSGGTAVTIATVTGAQAFAAGGVVIPVTLTAAGSYTLSATYAGSSVYTGSTGTFNVVIPATSTTLTLTGPATAVSAVNGNYVVTLTGTTSATGNVVVTATLNGTAGPTATVTAAQAIAGATVPLAFPSAGTYSITATYAGDSQNAASTSTGLSVVVTAAPGKPSFTITQTTTATIDIRDVADTPGVRTLTLTALNGYSTPVTFSFAGDGNYAFPDVLVATVKDHKTQKVITSVTPTADGTTVDIVFTYTTKTAANVTPHRERYSVYFAGGLLFFTLLGVRKRGRRAALTLLGVCLVVSSGALLAGCADIVPIDVTATPTTTTQGAAPQTIQISVWYNEGGGS